LSEFDEIIAGLDATEWSHYRVRQDEREHVTEAVWVSGPERDFPDSDALRWPHFLELVKLVERFTDGPVAVTPDWGIVAYDSVLGRVAIDLDHIERMDTRMRMFGMRGLARTRRL
jgi:hypothetical protein